ncbi:hypothetical protein [Sinorhizobium sojae]|uniref:hypothetical protein n=1 Tax=Sinorhizobium sojae TaxID=716925 RepID=UPI0005574395|nr:hypothetical protein [Sinorhizobium sojae]
MSEIKALEWKCSPEWKPGEFVTEWFVFSVAGHYRLWHDDTVTPAIWHVSYPVGSEQPYEGTEHPNIEAAKAAAQSAFDARIRSAIERKAEPVASRPMLGDMPSYGRASFSDLVKAVALAIYDREDVPIDVDLGEFIGHQMVPRINFNSLNRIVSAFSTPPAAPVRDEVVSQAVCRLLQQLGAIPTKNISQHDRDVRTLIDALSASPSPVTEEESEPCAVCGNEERGQGGYLSCECPAPSPVGESRDALIERLEDELACAASLLEALSECLPEDDVSGVMMRVMAARNRLALAAKEQQP